MKIAEFVELMGKAQYKRGYRFTFETRCKLLPIDNTFKPVPVHAIRYRNPELDPRSFYPIEAVWHCFYRKGDLQLQLPGCYLASRDMKLSPKRAADIVAAGEDYYIVEEARADKVRKIRKHMLRVLGLKDPH